MLWHGRLLDGDGQMVRNIEVDLAVLRRAVIRADSHFRAVRVPPRPDLSRPHRRVAGQWSATSRLPPGMGQPGTGLSSARA